MEAFWRVIRHDFIRLSIHTPSDPVTPALEIDGEGDMYTHDRVICGDGEEVSASWASVPGEWEGKMEWIHTIGARQPLTAID